MAREPPTRFQQQQQEIHFKAAAAASSPASSGCDLFPITGYYGNPASRFAGGMIFSPGVSQSSMDSVQEGLKHDTGLAVEWSIDEQYKLEEGLAKYGNEPNIMRYIKIAALLRDKTVRDVALRCKWMARKRRKPEEQNIVKKAPDRKEHLVKTSSKNSFSASPSVNAFSLTTNNDDQSNSMLCGAFSGASRHLLEENNRAFVQISENLSSLKLHQNIDLFFRTKSNLAKILNNMRNTPGIMSRMPPLPLVLNEELASRIFPPFSQPMIFSSPTVTSLKQEPGC